MMTSAEFVDALEKFGAAALSLPDDESIRRRTVAMTCGYMDARTMVYFFETHGLHIADQVLICAKKNLKVDWSGLHLELLRIGKKESSVVALIKEAQELERG